MRRLSIIDLASSHQPLSNERGDVWTVFNGEIFNFRELRDELQARGHRLATAGDTETIVHLYEEHGTDFPKRLRGMFGIAVWDESRRRLVLTRDRMGVKPLYYALTPRGLAFGSEIKSLLAGGLVEPRLDPLAAELYLAYGYVPGPRTLFEGVRKLAPATTLVWEDGELVGESVYWTPWEGAEPSGASWEEDQETLLRLLRESVRARMVSDVPLGVMLSGGLDSSLVTALMSEVSTEPVKTFSVGFTEDAQANELADARRVAQRFGTDHHELLTSATEHPSLIEEALWHLEEPIVDLSFLGFLLLSRLAREHVTVALCGQAADELLGGYPKHAVAHAADHLARVPAPGRRAVAAVGGRLPRWLPPGPGPACDGDRGRRRAPAADEPRGAGGPAPRAAEPRVPQRRGRPRAAPGHPLARQRPRRQRAARDAVSRHQARARGPDVPLLRQDVDGDVAGGPRPVRRPRRRLVLHGPSRRPADHAGPA